MGGGSNWGKKRQKHQRGGRKIGGDKEGKIPQTPILLGGKEWRKGKLELGGNDPAKRKTFWKEKGKSPRGRGQRGGQFG